MQMQELFKLAVEKKASDLHLAVGSCPILRINGELTKTDFEVLTPRESKRLVYSLLSEVQRKQFEETLELDFSLSIPGLSRFRVNAHQQRGSIEAALRVIYYDIPTLNDLSLPPIVTAFARKESGLILVTGPTGMGKTTTLAAMIDLINREKKRMIICIEDPVEYVHRHNKSIVKQREVYSDTRSFAEALKRALRQDPDVIVIGEMRDLETVSLALTASETGHLVLATLHTPDAAQTIDRIIDVFPPFQQQTIKVQLAGSLEGIICQQLLPRLNAEGRIVATEILIKTPAVGNLIREHKTEQIPTIIQTGVSLGMKTMDRSLRELCQREAISYEVAMTKVKNPAEFKEVGKRR